MMVRTVAPQEDQLKLPTAWKNWVLPRRGTPYQKPVKLADPEAVAAVARERADNAEDLRIALDLAGNKPYAAAGRAYLDGEADPRGAAVIAALLLDPKERYTKSWMRPEFDVWYIEHGLQFAIAAAVEFLAVQEGTDTYLERPPIAQRVLNESPASRLEMISHETGEDGIAAARSLLASASDDEYAATVAAVADHRRTPAARIAAMLLLPDEHEWVLEGCADFLKARENPYRDDIVWLSMSSAEQIAAVGILEVEAHSLGVDEIASLVANLGVDAFPLLTGPLAKGVMNFHGRHYTLEAVSLLPSDEAMAYLLGRLKSASAPALAVKAAENFPLRTLRVAARLAPTMTAEERSRLVAIAALPDTALRVHLDPTEQAALDDLFATTGFRPEAASEDLPPLLVNPSWTRKRPKAVTVKGLKAPAESHLIWAEGEQEAWNAIPDPTRHNEFWLENFGTLPDLDAYSWRLTRFLAHGALELAEPRLEEWDGSERNFRASDLQLILARFGERVVDRVLSQSHADDDCFELPGPLLSLKAARITAERLVRIKAARPHALRWLDRHGLAAVPYLVPDALFVDKDRRQYAEAALNHLAVRHGK
jgi:hypothetical protein